MFLSITPMTSPPGESVNLYAVEYFYDPTTADGRAAAREAHRAWVADLVHAGAIASTGPFQDGSGGLMLLWASSLSEAAEALDSDPYVRDGLARTTVREWKPVVGAFAD
jgi:uncharacterized protein